MRPGRRTWDRSSFGTSLATWSPGRSHRRWSGVGGVVGHGAAGPVSAHRVSRVGGDGDEQAGLSAAAIPGIGGGPRGPIPHGRCLAGRGRSEHRAIAQRSRPTCRPDRPDPPDHLPGISGATTPGHVTWTRSARSIEHPVQQDETESRCGSARSGVRGHSTGCHSPGGAALV